MVGRVAAGCGALSATAHTLRLQQHPRGAAPRPTHGHAELLCVYTMLGLRHTSVR